MKLEKIYKDKRGVIYRLMVDGKEYMVIETKKGYARGGDYHQSIQHDIVLKGQILWEERDEEDNNIGKVMVEGESNIVSPEVPHMYTSLTDSIVLEWLDGSYERKYYDPYRKKIEALMK